MIEVPEPKYYHNFTAPMFFIRTGKVRSSPQECTREELTDLMVMLLNQTEESLALLEKATEATERILGYRESLIQ